MLRLKSFITLGCAVIMAACATAATPKPAGSSPDLISSAEIVASGSSNAYEAINRIRPNWFRARGTARMVNGNIASQNIAVFVDGQRLGDVASLSTLSTTGLKSMQWLDAARAATMLSGLGSEPISGAILIKTH